MTRPTVSEANCAAWVYPPDGWGATHSCGRRGKVERGGKAYCLVHDPERIAARQAARDAQVAAQSAERNARWDREAQRRRDIEAVVRAMAERYGMSYEYSDAGLWCEFCGGLPQTHREGCVVLTARAIVAEWDAAKPRPTTAELTGSDPDFTGEITTAEYIADIRGD